MTRITLNIIAVLVVWVSGGLPAMAYVAVPHAEVIPYEVVVLPQSPSVPQIIYGTLDGYPEMIEFTLDATTTLALGLRAMPRTEDALPNLSGIVIRVEEPRGVREIARLEAGEASWSTERDRISRLPFEQGPVVTTEVGPGLYRFEVSTPDGFGTYLITVGDVSRGSGLFTTWRSVRALYDFYDAPKIGMLFTPVVFYPLGIIVVLCGIAYTVYRTRSRWRNP